jgi:hypothetical protein
MVAAKPAASSAPGEPSVCGRYSCLEHAHNRHGCGSGADSGVQHAGARAVMGAAVANTSLAVVAAGVVA